MAQRKTAPDGLRALREGEIVVDCAKARTLFESSAVSSPEEAAANEINITRSVLRRILGRDGSRPWNIVKTAYARAFAVRCGGKVADLEWAAPFNAQVEISQ